jgi:hypothetical protein
MAVALATLEGIYGARLLVYGVLATNARMDAVAALATLEEMYGARLFSARF